MFHDTGPLSCPGCAWGTSLGHKQQLHPWQGCLRRLSTGQCLTPWAKQRMLSIGTYGGPPKKLTLPESSFSACPNGLVVSHSAFLLVGP